MANKKNKGYPSIVKGISLDKKSLRLAERVAKAEGNSLSGAVRRCITTAGPGLIKKAKLT